MPESGPEGEGDAGRSAASTPGRGRPPGAAEPAAQALVQLAEQVVEVGPLIGRRGPSPPSRGPCGRRRRRRRRRGRRRPGPTGPAACPSRRRRRPGPWVRPLRTSRPASPRARDCVVVPGHSWSARPAALVLVPRAERRGLDIVNRRLRAGYEAPAPLQCKASSLDRDLRHTAVPTARRSSPRSTAVADPKTGQGLVVGRPGAGPGASAPAAPAS